MMLLLLRQTDILFWFQHPIESDFEILKFFSFESIYQKKFYSMTIHKRDRQVKAPQKQASDFDMLHIGRILKCEY